MFGFGKASPPAVQGDERIRARFLVRHPGFTLDVDLDLPERQVILDEAGGIAEIRVRDRLDSMRLIEDYMIAANVAAAKALETIVPGDIAGLQHPAAGGVFQHRPGGSPGGQQGRGRAMGIAYPFR